MIGCDMDRNMKIAVLIVIAVTTVLFIVNGP